MSEKQTDSTAALNADVSEGAKQNDQQPKIVAPVSSVGEAKPSYKQPCILIFDSLMCPHFGVVRTLREYLQEEWNAKKRSSKGDREFNKDNMKTSCVKCPQQSNFSDCGIYVLQYAESFFTKPITNFAFPFAPLENWFPEADVLKKRETLRQLVVDLQSRLNPELKYDVQQGSVPPTPVMSDTSAVGATATDASMVDSCVNTTEDATVLNAVAADADNVGLLQTDPQQFDANEHRLPEESKNISVAMPPAGDDVPDVTDIVTSASDVSGDVESVTAQTVAIGTCVEDINSLNMNLLAAGEQPICLMSNRNLESVETEVSDSVSTGASVCSSLMTSLLYTSNHSIISSPAICGLSVTERTDGALAASAALSAAGTDAADVTGPIGCSVSSSCRVSDTASGAGGSSSDCVVPSVDNSFVCVTKLRNNSHEIHSDSTA